MKRVTFITAVFLLSLINTFAQKEYKPAYVITTDYDTIYGFVSNDADNKLSGICQFKLNETSEPVKYKPEDLIGYRFINDKFFITKPIPIGDKIEKRFVEYLINGIVSIYSYSTVNGVRYFAQKEGDETLRELIQSEKEVYINNERYVNVEKPFINALSLLMIDAPELTGKIEDTNLGRKSLINISKEYHNMVCKDHSCITYEKKIVKPLIQVGVVADYNYTDLIERDITIYDEDVIIHSTAGIFEDEFSKSYSPAIGLSVKYFFPGSNNKIFLKYENLILKHEFNTLYYVNSAEKYKCTITSVHMRNSFTAGKYFFDNRVRPVIEAGGYLCNSLKLKYTGLTSSSEEILHDKLYLGLTFAGGFSIKLNSGYYLDVIAEANRSLSVYSYFNMNEYDLRINVPVFVFNRQKN